MPGFDGTGPMGLGPMTGGGRGPCRFYMGAWGPWGRPYPGYGYGWGYPYGWVGPRFGFGRGMGFGRGRGLGRGFGWRRWW